MGRAIAAYDRRKSLRDAAPPTESTKPMPQAELSDRHVLQRHAPYPERFLNKNADTPTMITVGVRYARRKSNL